MRTEHTIGESNIYSDSNFTRIIIYKPLEVVGRDSETQLQVVKK